MSDLVNSIKAYKDGCFSLLQASQKARFKAVSSLNDADQEVERTIRAGLIERSDEECKDCREYLMENVDMFLDEIITGRITQLQAAKDSFDSDLTTITKTIEEFPTVPTTPAGLSYRTPESFKDELTTFREDLFSIVDSRITLLGTTSQYLKEIKRERCAQTEKRTVRSEETTPPPMPGPYDDLDAGEVRSDSTVAHSYATIRAHVKATAASTSKKSLAEVVAEWEALVKSEQEWWTTQDANDDELWGEPESNREQVVEVGGPSEQLGQATEGGRRKRSGLERFYASWRGQRYHPVG